jgi:outer membrane lipoprotein-sorting protein
MKMRPFLPLALLALLPLLLSALPLEPHPAEESASSIARQMFVRTKGLKSLSYSMRKTERIDGALEVQESTAKIEIAPIFKVYTKQLAPKAGIEVLYVEGERNGMAVINPNGFPWVNLHLNPYGSVMRKKQHHTLLDAGYAHVVSILEFLFDKYGAETAAMSTLSSERWEGRDCWKVQFRNPYFRHDYRTVEAPETVRSWAAKHKLSEHMILENNPALQDYEANIQGLRLLLPNDYSPQMTLLIDKALMVPLVMEVLDDKGLYERYEYRDVRLNPTFKAEEFTTDYEEYGF